MPQSNKQARRAAQSSAQEKAAALKAQAQREERRRKLLARGGIGLAVVAVVGVVTGVGLASNHGTKLSGPITVPPAEGAATKAPWAAPKSAETYVEAAGLASLPQEQTQRHDHVHLDIYIDGKSTPVPTDIGIDQTTGSFSPLHTHDDTGVVHIEAESASKRFSLGQVFNEWNVLLTKSQIGAYQAGGGKTLAFYVNGKPYTGDPRALELLKHQEIAIVYGTAAENATVKVPSSYKWTDGL